MGPYLIIGKDPAKEGFTFPSVKSQMQSGSLHMLYKRISARQSGSKLAHILILSDLHDIFWLVDKPIPISLDGSAHVHTQ